jgi:protein SCO1/2
MTRLTRRSALLLALAACAADLRAAALPGDSIYQLEPHLVDQDGKPFALAATRGGPVLASMFYSSCEMVCPALFETIAQTLKALPAAQRERVRVVMVSFDPERDTVEVLKDTAQKHGCGPNWTLARGSAADVRRIAAVLGVQYRRLDSGEFNHSTQIALLDADGRIAQRSGLLGEVDPALVQALRRAVEGG